VGELLRLDRLRSIEASPYKLAQNGGKNLALSIQVHRNRVDANLVPSL